MSAAPPKIAVYLDRANFYRCARECFDFTKEPAWKGNIWPHKLARVLARRNGRAGNHDLVHIEVHTGLPDAYRQKTGNLATRRQISYWEDRAKTLGILEVRARPLAYYNTPRGEEKGVDVALAVSALRCAIGNCDTVIIASHDSDLQPAVETIKACFGAASIETASWKSDKFHQQIKAIHGVVNHTLDLSVFQSIEDTIDYTSAPAIPQPKKPRNK